MTRIANATTDSEEHEEIEITPEMIEAGASVRCGFETFTVSEEYWAEMVYRAMRSVAMKKL
jgi:hypothetical protein